MSEDCAVKKQKIWRRVLQWAFDAEGVASLADDVMFTVFLLVITIRVLSIESDSTNETLLITAIGVVILVWYCLIRILGAIKNIK